MGRGLEWIGVGFEGWDGSGRGGGDGERIKVLRDSP